MAVRNCFAFSETRISTGRLFQTEGAAWLNERIAFLFLQQARKERVEIINVGVM